MKVLFGIVLFLSSYSFACPQLAGSFDRYSSGSHHNLKISQHETDDLTGYHISGTDMGEIYGVTDGKERRVERQTESGLLVVEQHTFTCIGVTLVDNYYDGFFSQDGSRGLITEGTRIIQMKGEKSLIEHNSWSTNNEPLKETTKIYTRVN